MKAANIYLSFDGNCREAMTFYGRCLPAEPNFTSFGDVPEEMAAAGGVAPDRILHAELAVGPVVLMAADTAPGATLRQGNNFSISISCESRSELETLFAALGEGGEITLPLNDAFWGGRFGMLKDRFGIGWMLSFRAAGEQFG